jgi:hypothetical protein
MRSREDYGEKEDAVMKLNIQKILMLALVLTLAVLPLAATRAAAVGIDIPATPFAISKLGDLTIVLKDGVPQTIVARGQEFKAMGVYPTINGMVSTADVLLTSNLTLVPATLPLKFDHYGTIGIMVGDHILNLKYIGQAIKVKDEITGAKTLKSYGDFVITDGTGGFKDLAGLKGTYTLDLVCRGVPGEHPKVGSLVEVTFSAKGE